MKKIIYTLTTFLFFYLPVSLYAETAEKELASDAKPSAAPSLFIAKVLDPSGNVLAGANLILSPQNDPLKRKHYGSDEQGCVKVPHSDFKGEVYWSLQHPLYSNQGGAHFKLSEYNAESPFLIQLKKEPALKGVILDDKNKPLAGAQVRIDRDVPAKDHTHRYQAIDQDTTDIDGKFQVDSFAAGKFFIYAEKEHWMSKGILEFTHPNQAELKINLVPAHKLVLDIIDHKNKLVDNMKVEWYWSKDKVSKYDSSKTKVKETLTTGNTHPINSKVPEQSGLQLRISHNNIVTKELLNLTLDDKKPLQVKIDYKPIIKGAITDKVTQAAIEKVTVHAKYQEENYFRDKEKSSQTDKNGRYNLPMVKDGLVDITYSATGYKTHILKDVELKLNEKQLSDIVLDRGELAKFKFWDDSDNESKPIADTSLQYMLLETSLNTQHNHKTQTNSVGEITLTGWSEGDSVVFKLAGYAAKKVSLVASSDLKEIHLVKAAQLQIKVVDAQGKAIEKATFSVKNLGDEFFEDEQIWRKAKFNKASKLYAIPDLSPHRYEFQVKAKGYVQSPWQSIEMSSAQNEQLKVVLKAASKINLKVEVDQGTAADQLSISMKNIQNRYAGYYTAKLDKTTERYQFDLDRDDAITMELTMKGYIPVKGVQIKEDAPNDHVYTIKFKKGLRFTGLVSNEAGESLSEAQVSLSGTGFNKSEKTDAEGVFKLEGIPNGSFKIQIKKDLYAPKELNENFENDLLNYAIVLNKGAHIKGIVINEQQEPVPEVSLTLMVNNGFSFNEAYELGNTRNTKSNSAGQFEYEGLKAGSYKIIAKHNSAIAESAILEVTEKAFIDNQVLTLKDGLKLSGKAVDLEGNPVANLEFSAEFSAYGVMGGGKAEDVKTGLDGAFSFSGLTKGNYVLTLISDSHEIKNPAGLYGQNLYEAGREDLIIEVSKSELLHGLVVTPDDKKIDQYVISYRDESTKFTQVVETQTREGHSFTFLKSKVNQNNPYLQKSEIFLIATAQGYNPAEVKVDLSQASDQPIELHLKPEKHLDLLIVDSSGNPVDGVEVKFQKASASLRSNFYGGVKQLNYSDTEGKLTIKGIESGKYDFQLLKAGFAKTVSTIDVDPESTQRHQLQLDKGGRITGKVIDSQYTGIPNCSVFLKENTPNNFSTAFQVLSNRDGEFIMNHVPVGIYRIDYSKQKERFGMNLNPNAQVIEVEEGAELNLTLGVQSEQGLASISARIEGEAVYMMAQLTNGVGMPAKQMQIKNSKFEMNAIPPGSYTLMVVSMTGNMLKRTVELKADETLEIVFETPKTKLIAKVVDSQGQPVSMMQALLMNPDIITLDQNSAMEAFDSFAIIQNGDLNLNVNKAGKYTLTISGMPGLGNGQSGHKAIEVTIIEGEVLDLGTITLDAGITLRGLVKNNEGLPIEGASFVIMKGNFPNMDPTWKSNASGQFELKQVPNLPLQLTVNASGYVAQTLNVESNDLIVTLEKAAQLKVQLSGSKISGRQLELIDLNENEGVNDFSKLFAGLQQTNTDRYGSYKFTELEAGDYQIKVLPLLPNETEVLSQTIHLEKGSSQTLNLPLND